VCFDPGQLLGAQRFSPFAKKAQRQKMGPLALMIFAGIMAHTHYKFLSLALAAPARDAIIAGGWNGKAAEFEFLMKKFQLRLRFGDDFFLFLRLKWGDLMGMREVVCSC
jgi:hypothetical protein